MDTTLRDGEQTSGMSFSSSEKLAISKLLIEELKVDRIEIASARVSDGEFEAVKKITLKFNYSYLVIAKSTMLNNEYKNIKETLFQDLEKIK